MLSTILLVAAKTAGEMAVSQFILGINSGIAVYLASKKTSQTQGRRKK